MRDLAEVLAMAGKHTSKGQLNIRQVRQLRMDLAWWAVATDGRAVVAYRLRKKWEPRIGETWDAKYSRVLVPALTLPRPAIVGDPIDPEAFRQWAGHSQVLICQKCGDNDDRGCQWCDGLGTLHRIRPTTLAGVDFDSVRLGKLLIDAPDSPISVGKTITKIGKIPGLVLRSVDQTWGAALVGVKIPDYSPDPRALGSSGEHLH